MRALRRIGARIASGALRPRRALQSRGPRAITTLEIFLGGFGLVAALVAAALLSPALGALPGAAGDFAPIGIAILLAPIGVGVALSRRVEIERLVRSLRERTESVASAVTAGVAGGERVTSQQPPQQVVVDTSAIIDGRLADVAATGFLLAELIIPRFVLDELRRVADSSDPLRRQRGRRGLEMLARLQADALVRVTIADRDFLHLPDVDARLLALARERGAAIITTDFNLSRVAGVEGLRVLNLNALAQAVRAALLPGELLTLHVHQEGREHDQGVGFLEDGTMVVVENGRRLLGQDVEVEITRSIQTSAGRMLFAQPRPAPAPAATPQAIPSETM